MSDYTLNAHARQGSGRAANNKIKKQGLIPAVYYYHGEDSVLLAIDEKDVRAFMKTPHAIVNLKVGNKTYMAVTKEVQFQAGKKIPAHLSFQGVNTNETFTAFVPIHFHHEEECGWQNEGGVLQTNASELEIECLPQDMPQSIEVDVSTLAIGDTYSIGQIKLKGVTFLEDPEHVIASIILPKVEAEPENTTEDTVIPIETAAELKDKDAAKSEDAPKIPTKAPPKDDKKKAS